MVGHSVCVPYYSCLFSTYLENGHSKSYHIGIIYHFISCDDIITLSLYVNVLYPVFMNISGLVTQKKERVLRISWVPCPFYIQDSILIYFFHGLRRMFPPRKSFHVSGEHGRTTWIRAHSETISSVKIDENRMEIHSNKPKATTEYQRFSAPVPRP